MEKTAIRHITSLVVLLLAGEVSAFTFVLERAVRYEGLVIEILANIPDITADDLPLNQGFADAAFQWSSATPVTINVTNEFKNPCDVDGGDRLNSIIMSADICGASFHIGDGVNALAATTGIVEESTFLERDIFFNSEYTWDIYDGPVRFTPHNWAALKFK